MRFAKEIEKIAYRHQIVRVFDDFLQMAICAFSFGKMEDRYAEICQRYDPDERKMFGNVLGAMVLDYEDAADNAGSWGDVLGRYFEQTNSSSQASAMGQFFTPEHICDLMARITVPQDQQGQSVTVNDPSCGSGRNLIAHCRLHPDNRMGCFYTACDLDYRCVNMTALNFVMYGMRGVVIHMNTLSLKIYSGYRVYLPETGLGIQPLTDAQCREFLFSQKPADDQPQTVVQIEPQQPGEQLKLFGQ